MKRFDGYVLGIVLALLPAGCSVREDRLSCPCYLDIDYRIVLSAGREGFSPGAVDVSVYAPDSVWRRKHPLSSCPETDEVVVRRDSVRVIALLGGTSSPGFPASGTRMTYGTGKQIDSLYVHTEQVDCSGEEARALLHPRKQFSTLSFSDGEDGERFRQFDWVLQGTTCGLDLADLSAVEGDYSVQPVEIAGTGGFQVRIPRQVRPDLVIAFRSRAHPLNRFVCPVGRHLFEAGYDPAAPDLPDYDLRIDFRQALVYLRIADWTEETIYSLYD